MTKTLEKPQKVKIAIFEDDEIRKVYKKILENKIEEHSIDSVEVSVYKERPEQTIFKSIVNHDATSYIIDLNLGNGVEEGIKLVKDIRENSPNAFITVFSASKKTEINNESFEAGADRVCRKDKKKASDLLHETLQKTIRMYNFQKELSKPNQVIIYNSEVIDISREKVLLSFSLDNNDENAKELWFDKNRVDDPENIVIGNCYYMKDNILEYGKSCLKFEFTENDLFEHEKGLEEELKKIDNPEDFYKNE